VVRLDTTAVLAAMIQNVPAAQAIILLSVKIVQNGSLRRVQRIKVEKNISFAEARKVAAGENESRPSLDTRTIAEVMRPRSK